MEEEVIYLLPITNMKINQSKNSSLCVAQEQQETQDKLAFCHTQCTLCPHPHLQSHSLASCRCWKLLEAFVSTSCAPEQEEKKTVRSLEE